MSPYEHCQELLRQAEITQSQLDDAIAAHELALRAAEEADQNEINAGQAVEQAKGVAKNAAARAVSAISRYYQAES